MANERISQILPTVKCSDCGEDVQIRKLGEHVCSNMPAIPPLPIIPPRQGKKVIALSSYIPHWSSPSRQEIATTQVSVALLIQFKSK